MRSDLRSHSRYRRARAAWLAGYRGQPGTCCLCGQPVDTSITGRLPWGPTIEHRYPIRAIIVDAPDWAAALALACDTTWWDLAHKRCQDQQGAHAANSRRTPTQAPRIQGSSRAW